MFDLPLEYALIAFENAEPTGKIVPELLDRTIHQITGQCNQVGFQAVDSLDHILDEGPSDSLADVDVGYLNDTQTLEVFRQILNRNCQLDNSRFAKGFIHSVGHKTTGHRQQPGIDRIHNQRSSQRIDRFGRGSSRADQVRGELNCLLDDGNQGVGDIAKKYYREQ